MQYFKIETNNTIKKVPKLKATFFLIRSLIIEIGGIIFKKISIRNEEQINKEYNDTKYSDILKNTPWLNFESLKSYISNSKDDHKMVIRYMDEYFFSGSKEYYQERQKYFQETITSEIEDEKDVVELGCGTGIQVFTLSLLNRFKTIHGLDLSPNAIQVANSTLDFFSITNTSFGIIDLTDPNHFNWQMLRGKTIYTHHCLEQLKRFTPQVIQNIIKAKPAKVIHIEPTTETLSLRNPKDWLHFLYTFRMDYLDNLLKTLKTFQELKQIKIEKTKRLPLSPTIRHTSTLVVWKPL